MRARIDLSEIEAQTKIRARYLRALENEEWQVLPGATFIKSFLRTYAEALGLDPKPLLEEYRRDNEGSSDGEPAPIVAPSRHPARPARPRREGGESEGIASSRGYRLAVGAIVVVIVVLVVALATHGSKKATHGRTTGSVARSGHRHVRKRAGSGVAKRASASSRRVTLSLKATAVVWVCLVDAQERKLIPGEELQPGQSSGPYTGTRFAMLLGNDDVTLTVDGKALTVPESSQAIGYEVSSSGARTLTAASEPSCT